MILRASPYFTGGETQNIVAILNVFSLISTQIFVDYGICRQMQEEIRLRYALYMTILVVEDTVCRSLEKNIDGEITRWILPENAEICTYHWSKFH